MYSSLNIVKNSKNSGKLIGTHQKLDKAARRLFSKTAPKKHPRFPTEAEILYFEGSRGPDGIKRKSPGVDEPWHFIDPADSGDQQLISTILDHQHNLRTALAKQDQIRAAFEAAWLAHAITDGLTPAHHYPYEEVVDELMVDMDYKKIFGVEIKGIMRGRSLLEATRNNWLYWGAGGVMTKHVSFELGVAYAVAALPLKTLTPKLTKVDPANIDLTKEFQKSLKIIATRDMYGQFIKGGWTTALAMDVREMLVPEIVRVVTLAWLSSLAPAKDSKKPAKAKSKAKK